MHDGLNVLEAGLAQLVGNAMNGVQLGAHGPHTLLEIGEKVSPRVWCGVCHGIIVTIRPVLKLLDLDIASWFEMAETMSVLGSKMA